MERLNSCSEDEQKTLYMLFQKSGFSDFVQFMNELARIGKEQEIDRASKSPAELLQ